MNTTTKPIPTDLAEFEKFLERHDWFYDFSDDHGVWQRGLDADSQLLSFTRKSSDDHKRLYNKAHAKRYNTPVFTSHGRTYHFPFPEVES